MGKVAGYSLRGDSSIPRFRYSYHIPWGVQVRKSRRQEGEGIRRRMTVGRVLSPVGASPNTMRDDVSRLRLASRLDFSQHQQHLDKTSEHHEREAYNHQHTKNVMVKL
jgi:hypothetical protein